jgi:hypothetical protein
MDNKLRHRSSRIGQEMPDRRPGRSWGWISFGAGGLLAAGGAVVLVVGFIGHVSSHWNAFFGAYCIGLAAVAIMGSLASSRTRRYILVSGAAGGVLALGFVLIFSIGILVLLVGVLLAITAARDAPAHRPLAIASGAGLAAIAIAILLIGFNFFYLS